MKRLAFLPLLAILLGGLGLAGTASSDTFSSRVYLPAVMNKPFAWQNRALVPYYVYPPVGVAVNGQLYAIGVYSPQDFGDGHFHAAIYDPSSDTWTMRPGSIGGQWTDFPESVAVATNGKVYVAINSLTGHPDVLEYDPDSDSWRARATAPVVVSEYSWVAARNGKLYLIGGFGASGAVASVEAYDPTADSWTAVAAMPVAITAPSVAAAADGKIYVFGNDLVEIYAPASDTWNTLGATSLVTPMMGAVQASDGKIYMVGGPQSRSTGVPSNAALAYDPAANSWEHLTPLPRGEQRPSLVTTDGNELFVVGGYIGVGFDSEVYEATIPR